MARAKHPKKEVETALRDAESAGWTVTPTQSGHRWGVMRCGMEGPSGCQISIWSTPATPETTPSNCAVSSPAVCTRGTSAWEKADMSTFHFTLIVEGPDLQDGPCIDALFEAGCDDAAIGRSDGIQFADFDREAMTLDRAILSAVDDMEKLEGVEVVRIADAGLASLADIAAGWVAPERAFDCWQAVPAAPADFRNRSPTRVVAIGCGAGPMWSAGAWNSSARHCRSHRMKSWLPSVPRWSFGTSGVHWRRQTRSLCGSWSAWTSCGRLRNRRRRAP